MDSSSELKSRREERPWGFEDIFLTNRRSTVKLITVKSGEAFSLQSHGNRDEFWRIISGAGTITVGDKKIPVESGGEHFVSRGVKHRIEAGAEDVVFIEISLGDFDQADIKRFEDRYGRK